MDIMESNINSIRDMSNIKDNQGLEYNAKGLKNVELKTVTDKPQVTSFSRGEKIVTALYIVTDFMDKGEPIRQELRSMSLNMLHGLSYNKSASRDIEDLLSFINIATAVDLISTMNANVLKKALTSFIASLDQKLSALDFLAQPQDVIENVPYATKAVSDQNFNSFNPTKKTLTPSNYSLSTGTAIKTIQNKDNNTKTNNRTNDILKIIKDKREVTIKDISTNYPSCGEKTIQRELVSLTLQGIVKKTGEKRWSKYSIV